MFYGRGAAELGQLKRTLTLSRYFHSRWPTMRQFIVTGSPVPNQLPRQPAGTRRSSVTNREKLSDRTSARQHTTWKRWVNAFSRRRRRNASSRASRSTPCAASRPTSRRGQSTNWWSLSTLAYCRHISSGASRRKVPDGGNARPPSAGQYYPFLKHGILTDSEQAAAKRRTRSVSRHCDRHLAAAAQLV